MNLWHEIDPGKNAPDGINVIVEIPKGSQNKYEYDKDYNVFRLDRVLFSPIHYPGDYGMVPQTLGQDGDPLDALVLVTYPTHPGTLIHARPIGLLDMVDGGEEDEKILCVPLHDIRLSAITDLADIQQPILDEIAHFFEVYKKLEGKKVELRGWKHAPQAHMVIQEAIDRYNTSQS